MANRMICPCGTGCGECVHDRLLTEPCEKCEERTPPPHEPTERELRDEERRQRGITG